VYATNRSPGIHDDSDGVDEIFATVMLEKKFEKAKLRMVE
tara:strand:- start:3749 stop:3868 length:120 start_codon:yes stop_codon:yes gene_type:complete